MKVTVLSRRRVLKENERPFNLQEYLTGYRREILNYLSNDVKKGIISKVWTIDGVICFRPTHQSTTIERCTSLMECQDIVAKYS